MRTERGECDFSSIFHTKITNGNGKLYSSPNLLVSLTVPFLQILYLKGLNFFRSQSGPALLVQPGFQPIAQALLD